VKSHASTDPNTIDPTGGFVHYRNRNDSEALGMIGQTPAGNVYIGVDHTNPVVSADWPYGRNSVRVESKAQYKHGLFIFDLAHMPKPACGSWPALYVASLQVLNPTASLLPSYYFTVLAASSEVIRRDPAPFTLIPESRWTHACRGVPRL